MDTPLDRGKKDRTARERWETAGNDGGLGKARVGTELRKKQRIYTDIEPTNGPIETETKRFDTSPSPSSRLFPKSPSPSLTTVSLLARIASLEDYVFRLETKTSTSPDSALLQATITALKKDNDALRQEVQGITNIVTELEIRNEENNKKKREFELLKTCLEDSIHMLEDQLALQTAEKLRLESHVNDLEARFRYFSHVSTVQKSTEIPCFTRISDLEAENRRLNLLVENKDQENNRMVHRLHSFMQEAEEAKNKLQRLIPEGNQPNKRPGSRSDSVTSSMSRKSSFSGCSRSGKENRPETGRKREEIRKGKSARNSPTPAFSRLGKRDASVGRLRL